MIMSGPWCCSASMNQVKLFNQVSASAAPGLFGSSKAKHTWLVSLLLLGSQCVCVCVSVCVCVRARVHAYMYICVPPSIWIFHSSVTALTTWYWHLFSYLTSPKSCLEDKHILSLLCIPSLRGSSGNSSPFWYSCLETPMGRGAWWATVT